MGKTGGTDFYRQKASEFFHTPYSEVTPAQRQMAKRRLFMSMYGGSANTLNKLKESQVFDLDGKVYAMRKPDIGQVVTKINEIIDFLNGGEDADDVRTDTDS